MHAQSLDVLLVSLKDELTSTADNMTAIQLCIRDTEALEGFLTKPLTAIKNETGVMVAINNRLVRLTGLITQKYYETEGREECTAQGVYNASICQMLAACMPEVVYGMKLHFMLFYKCLPIALTDIYKNSGRITEL